MSSDAKDHFEEVRQKSRQKMREIVLKFFAYNGYYAAAINKKSEET